MQYHHGPSGSTALHFAALLLKLFQGKPDILAFHEGSSSVCSCSFILLFIGVIILCQSLNKYFIKTSFEYFFSVVSLENAFPALDFR